MKKWKERMLAVAEANNACVLGMLWLRKQTDPKCLISDESAEAGYMEWSFNQLKTHPEFAEYLKPKPEQYEKGLSDGKYFIRRAWAFREDLPLTPEQLERGLTDSVAYIRRIFLERRDVALSEEQIERGLTDTEWRVRYAMASLAHFKPTRAQMERGCVDPDLDVRIAFERLTT